MSMAPRTQDSGMLVEVSGSRSGSAAGTESTSDGKTPQCWCWKRARPSVRGSLVRVSATHIHGVSESLCTDQPECH